MKELLAFGILTGLFVVGAGKYGLWEEFDRTAKTVHNYEYKALALAKRVRELEKENNDLRGQLAQATTEKEHLALATKKKTGRAIASIPESKAGDLVNFDVYKWSPEKLLGVGEKELHFKNYDKSAQFFNTLIEKFPGHKLIDDQVLFKAGIAAYESRVHYDWATNHFGDIIKKYPNSKFFRGAKLWMGLAHFYQGNHSQFMATVEEFKQKYRNTGEWQVLSRYYEDLAFNYKQKE